MKTNHAIIAAISVLLSTWTLNAQDNPQPNPPSGEGEPRKENAARPEVEKPHRHRDEAGLDAPRGETSRGERSQRKDRPSENQRPQNAERPNRDGGNFAPRGEGRRWQRGESEQRGPGDGHRFGHHRRHHHKWRNFDDERQQSDRARPQQNFRDSDSPERQQHGPDFAQRGERRMDARSQDGRPPFAGRPGPEELKHLLEMMRERWAQDRSHRDHFRPQPPQDGPRFQQQDERRMDARSQNRRPRFDERPDFQQRDPRFERMSPQGPGPMNGDRREMRQGPPPPPQWDRFAPPPREHFAPPPQDREQFRPQRRPPQDDWQEQRR